MRLMSHLKIVYTDYFSDAEGNTSEDLPASTTTMTFEELDGRTKIVSRTVYESADELKKVLEMGMEEGITQTWDRLEEYVLAKK
ncbi:SRPBCC domain-containing protein [Paenibacillus lactis]